MLGFSAGPAMIPPVPGNKVAKKKSPTNAAKTVRKRRQYICFRTCNIKFSEAENRPFST